ncbi:hypothetical protein ACQEPB_00410 [Novosphingobium fluoreni]|uniref:hypothetical protein n=1 Tax=Novosphingobium fluoreni TaxID=1391222 RepID=UPI003DA15FDD
MTIMARRPSFQFYPSDWRTETGLRLCSLGAKGLWIEMLTIMHEGEPYGHLTMEGRAIAPEMLARLIGEAPATVKRLVKELEENKVFSRTDNGVIFSRRMVRDEDARDRRAAGGSAGAAHGHKGALHGAKGGRPKGEQPPISEGQTGDKKPPSGAEKTPLEGKQKPPPSSSSSSSSSVPPTPKRYAFEGRTLRLNQRDFDQWAESYNAIPDLRAELQSIDSWFQGANVPEAKRKSWFEATSRMLGRKHQELLASRRQQDDADAKFFARHPEQRLPENEWRALMGDEEFERRKHTLLIADEPLRKVVAR